MSNKQNKKIVNDLVPKRLGHIDKDRKSTKIEPSTSDQTVTVMETQNPDSKQSPKFVGEFERFVVKSLGSFKIVGINAVETAQNQEHMEIETENPLHMKTEHKPVLCLPGENQKTLATRYSLRSANPSADTKEDLSANIKSEIEEDEDNISISSIELVDDSQCDLPIKKQRDTLSKLLTDTTRDETVQPNKKVKLNTVPMVHNHGRRLTFIGDYSASDFIDPKNKKQFLELQKEKKKCRKEVHTLHTKKSRIDSRILKVRSTLKVIRDNCTDLPVDSSKLDELCQSDGEYDSDYSDDLTTGIDQLPPNSEPIPNQDSEIYDDTIVSENIDDPEYENKAVTFCNFSFANQVQVTFSSDNEDKQLRIVRKRLAWAAEQDVTLSQEIYRLQNALFLKNKKIEELQERLASIRAEKEDTTTG